MPTHAALDASVVYSRLPQRREAVPLDQIHAAWSGRLLQAQLLWHRVSQVYGDNALPGVCQQVCLLLAPPHQPWSVCLSTLSRPWPAVLALFILFLLCAAVVTWFPVCLSWLCIGYLVDTTHALRRWGEQLGVSGGGEGGGV